MSLETDMLPLVVVAFSLPIVRPPLIELVFNVQVVSVVDMIVISAPGKAYNSHVTLWSVASLGVNTAVIVTVSCVISSGRTRSISVNGI